MQLKILPRNIADMIAAGEVVQRPSSVVKELMENAVDAGADQISVTVTDAGRTLIQVIDNGCGMSPDDAVLCFERHATSKIATAEDLQEITTFGFRGEALASIAAVADVVLRTRREEDEVGVEVEISGSEHLSTREVAAPKGSNFAVRNLFYNIPARRKFLKSDTVEFRHIVEEFQRVALTRPEIGFTLTHNGRDVHVLKPAKSLKFRIMDLLGAGVVGEVVDIAADTSLVRVHGFVGRPESAKKTLGNQFLFVNGRYFRSAYLHKAVMKAYEALIPEGTTPSYFIFLEVDPSSIDVNIHPTKTEIKFEDEMPIWQILAAGVKETLGRFSEVPSIDFDTQDAPTIPAYSSNVEVHRPEIDVDTAYNPFKSQGSSQPRQHAASVSNWDELYANFERKKRESTDEQQASLPFEEEPAVADVSVPAPAANVQTAYLQLKGRYILSPAKSGLMVIDQHRAHVRILFDRYIGRIHSGSMSSQTILFPEVLHLSPAQAVTLEGLLPEMEKMGFVLSRMSGNDWAVNAIPAGLDGVDAAAMVQQIIESVENGGMPLKKRILEHLALTVARSAAIPAGRTLMQEEMDLIVADLLRLPEPNYTPDGKTIIQMIPIDHIAKMF